MGISWGDFSSVQQNARRPPALRVIIMTDEPRDGDRCPRRAMFAWRAS